MKNKIIVVFLIICLIPINVYATANKIMFYSVSPYGTGDLKTGSPIMGITNSLASLSVAQIGNIGAGDCIEYTVVGTGSYKAYLAPSRLGFENGNCEIKPGYKIRGENSDAVGIVRGVELSSGSWVGGDAAGYIYFSNIDGAFSDLSENLHIIRPEGHSRIATSVEYTNQGNMTNQFIVKKVDGTAADDTPDGATVNVDSIHHEYASFSACEAGCVDPNHINNWNLPAIDTTVYCCGYYDHDDYTVDSTSLAVLGIAADSDNYISFYTPNGNAEAINNQRHDGKLNNNKYIMENASRDIVVLTVNYTEFQGIQTYQNSASATNGIELNRSHCDVSCNIIRAFLDGSDTGAYGIYGASSTFNSKVYNNIIYDFINGANDNRGMYFLDSNNYIYNNTIHNCYTGIVSSAGDYFKNNIVNDCSNACYSVTNADATSTHNIGNNASNELAFGATYLNEQADGTSANKLVDSDANFIVNEVAIGCIVKNTTDTTYTYVTALDSEGQLSVNDDIFESGENYTIYTNKFGAVTFNNEGADDFHLDANDVLALDLGSNLFYDSYCPVWMDIDGYERSYLGEGWDIGADELDEIVSPGYRLNIIGVKMP